MVNFKNNIELAIAIIAYMVLVLWYFSFQLSCYAITIFLVVAIFVSKASFEHSKAKKICAADCYLKKDTWMYKFFTKRFIIGFLSFISGLILTSIMMISITLFNVIDFIVLFLDIFILFFLYKYTIKMDFFNDHAKSPILKNFTAFINALLMMFVFLIVNLYQSPPQYIQNNLVETIHIAGSQTNSVCPFIDSIVGITKEVIATKWWLMLDITINTKDQYFFKEIMWILYSIGSYLVAFAYGRYILESVLVVNQYFGATDERK